MIEALTPSISELIRSASTSRLEYSVTSRVCTSPPTVKLKVPRPTSALVLS